MAEANTVQFGLEIELLISSRKKKHQSWESMAKEVSKRLAKAGVDNHINRGNDKSAHNYLEWSICQEVTIPSQPGKSIWGLELVSPVFTLCSYWRHDLETIFSLLQASFLLVPSPHCSTHVHLSTTPTNLTPGQLASLAKAALHFEPALDALVPPARRGASTYWCQPNRASPQLAPLPSPADMAIALDAAAARAGVRGVVEAMNLVPATGAYGRASRQTRDFVRGKVYKWDMAGMAAAAEGGTGRGTVEFRQAPGSLDAVGAGGWCLLAVCLLAGAVGGDGRFEAAMAAGYRGGVEDLWDLVMGGARLLGVEDVDMLEGVFSRREADV